MRMMHRRDDRQIDESCEGDANDIVEMHDIHAGCRVLYGPRCVIEVLQFGTDRVFDRPVCVRITPPNRAWKARITIRVNRHLMAACVEAACQVCNEQLRSAVSGGRHGDKRRSDESNLHVFIHSCKNGAPAVLLSTRSGPVTERKGKEPRERTTFAHSSVGRGFERDGTSEQPSLLIRRAALIGWGVTRRPDGDIFEMYLPRT
jgi:hypothetical protein